MVRWRLVLVPGLVLLLAALLVEVSPARSTLARVLLAQVGPGAEVTAFTNPAYACINTQPQNGCTTAAVLHWVIYNTGEMRTGGGGSADLRSPSTMFHLNENARLLFETITDSGTRFVLQLRHGAANIFSGGKITIYAGQVEVDTTSDPFGGGGSRPIQGDLLANPPPPGTTGTFFKVEYRETAQGNFAYVAIPPGGGSLWLRLNHGQGPDLRMADGYEILIPDGAQQFPQLQALDPNELEIWGQVIDNWASAMGSTAALPAVSASAPAPAPTSRYFAETKQTVAGKFLDYWNAHGGLAQFGYPLTGAFAESSDLNPGKAYTTQYFERAVFELHPENAGTPYEILLAQLGTYRYHARYSTAGAPGQHASTANPRKFAETGKTLGGRFRDYWEQHGGLAQFGYPISDEFTEASALDPGKRYTVQYFERALFEYHPENAGTPFDVLLAQLGTYYRQSK